MNIIRKSLSEKNMQVGVILNRLQIREIENKYPDQLFGGQQQKTAIGRAFMTRPEYLFCDEPTGNLDRKTSESVLHLLM